jgi:hypothetical protein
MYKWARDENDIFKLLENVKELPIYQQNKAILQIAAAISYFFFLFSPPVSSIFLIFALF